MKNESLKAKQVAEAKLRLKMLVKKGLLPTVEKEFIEDGTVFYSFHRGVLYWLKQGNNCDNLCAVVKKFEAKHNALVYHAIYTVAEFGDCLSLMFVSQNPDEWEYDREDLSDYNQPMVFVENLNDPSCSEFGYIEVRPFIGGLMRSA